MSRTARLALLLVGSIIACTALIGPYDMTFHPIEVPPGMRIMVYLQSA